MAAIMVVTKMFKSRLILVMVMVDITVKIFIIYENKSLSTDVYLSLLILGTFRSFISFFVRDLTIGLRALRYFSNWKCFLICKTCVVTFIRTDLFQFNYNCSQKHTNQICLNPWRRRKYTFETSNGKLNQLSVSICSTFPLPKPTQTDFNRVNFLTVFAGGHGGHGHHGGSEIIVDLHQGCIIYTHQ